MLCNSAPNRKIGLSETVDFTGTSEMIEIVSVPALIASPRYHGAAWLSTGLHWHRAESVILKALCEANAPLEKSADGLGRSPTSIAWRAAGTGLILPKEWKEAITKRRARTVSLREPQLQYPYIRNVRGEHADLLAVNSLVPRYLPDHVRADVCQEIMLAIWMKKFTLDELREDKSAIRGFVRNFDSSNFEDSGFAMSLDVPMRDGRSWYDVLPDTHAESDSSVDD